MKPGPTLTRIFGFGFFLGFLGFRGLCCPPYQHTQRGVKKFRENFAAASTAKLHQHCCCYSAPVKAAAVYPRNYSTVWRARVFWLFARSVPLYFGLPVCAYAILSWGHKTDKLTNVAFSQSHMKHIQVANL